MNHRFTDLQTLILFLLAGNSRLTVVSSVTGTRFTFRVRRPKTDGPHFVSVLTGDDNESSYTFLGTIFTHPTALEHCRYQHGKRSPISESAPSAQAFAWLWAHLSQGRFPAQCELWHEGRCGRCGRALTVPESIATGLGPECAARS